MQSHEFDAIIDRIIREHDHCLTDVVLDSVLYGRGVLSIGTDVTELGKAIIIGRYVDGVMCVINYFDEENYMCVLDATLKNANSEDNFVPCDAVTTIEVVNSDFITVVCGLRKGHAGLHYDKTCSTSWDPAPNAARAPAPTPSVQTKSILLEPQMMAASEDHEEQIRALRSVVQALIPYAPDTAVGRVIRRMAIGMLAATECEL